MFNYGETIGDYRVISRFSSDATSSSYFVEPSEREGKGLLVIRVWEQTQLVEADSRDTFLAGAGELVWLRHPSISPVFDYGIEKGRPYLVVEHYDPPLIQLSELLERNSFTQEQALTAVTELREALDYAHQAGVAHGRLSPEYVYLDADDKVVLEFPLLAFSKMGVQNGEGSTQERKLGDQHALLSLAQGLFNGYPLPEDLKFEPEVPETISPVITSTEQQLDLIDEKVEDVSQTLAPPTEVEQGSIEKTEVLASIILEEEQISIEKKEVLAVTAAEDVQASIEKKEVLVAPIAEEDRVSTQKTEAPAPVPVTISGQLEPAGQWRVKRSRTFQLVSLTVVVLFLLALAIPLTSRYVPAASAKITITPTSKHLKNLYTIRAVPGAADASRHEIQVRHLKTAANASAPVTASGSGSEEPAFATGKILLSNMSQAIENVGSLTLTVSGVPVVIDLTRPGTRAPVNPRPGETYELNARTQLMGDFGNVPARFFDGDHFFFATDVSGINSFSFTAHIENQAAFSGGKDGGSYVFLQKQDVDSVALPIIKGLKDSATKEVQKQMRPDEQPFVVSSSAEQISCAVNQTGNKINDRVPNGILTIEVTCEANVYVPQQAMLVASAWQKEEATRQLGAQYQLVGDLRTTLDKSQILIYGDVLHIPVATEGYWVYQFQTDQLRELTQSITGKASDEALIMLKNRPGIATSTIATSSVLGTALPWSIEQIEVTMAQVTGLRTTE